MDFQNILNIAYLGPEGSFSEMARDIFCDKFNINTFSTPLKNIPDVVEFVDKNPFTLGVIPVENSIDGTLRAGLDSLMTTKNPNIKILAEAVMPIEYCLLSRTTEFYSITGIIGTPYLMGKCKEFIQNELPRNLNVIEHATMVECARNLQNYNLTYGSIGNKKIAEHCMLNVLKENINDDKSNQTRYILIGDSETTPTGKDKTTIAFTVGNKPGALLEALNVFVKHGVNLTYTSSRPSKNNLDEFVLIVSLDGHISNDKILKVMIDLKPKTSFFRFLGSYSAL